MGKKWLKKRVTAPLDGRGLAGSSAEEVFSDPHVLAREMVIEVSHPTAGTVKMVGFPYKLSATPATVRVPPPLLGQHTEEVLGTLLSYSPEAVAGLRQRGVV